MFGFQNIYGWQTSTDHEVRVKQYSSKSSSNLVQAFLVYRSYRAFAARVNERATHSRQVRLITLFLLSNESIIPTCLDVLNQSQLPGSSMAAILPEERKDISAAKTEENFINIIARRFWVEYFFSVHIFHLESSSINQKGFEFVEWFHRMRAPSAISSSSGICAWKIMELDCTLKA